MTNQKHPLEAVVSVLEKLVLMKGATGIMDFNTRVYIEYSNEVFNEGQKALTTLREYISNEPKVEGLAEALANIKDVTGDSCHLNAKDIRDVQTVYEAAKLQLKRQGE